MEYGIWIESLAQRWADQHGLQTLVSAMGPLFSNRDVDAPRHGKSPKACIKYMRGASIRFAEYACCVDEQLFGLISHPTSTAQGSDPTIDDT